MKNKKNKITKKDNSLQNIHIDLDLDAIKASQQVANELVKNYGALDVIREVASQQSALTEISRNLASQVTEALKPALLVQESLRAYTQQIAKEFSRLQDQSRLVLESVASSTRLINSWVEQHREAFADIAKKLKEVQEQYKIAEKEVLPCLKKYKWFVTPSMPAAFIFEVYKIAKKRGNQSKAVNKLFFELVLADKRETLDELLNNWQGKIDDDRLKIIKDCFDTIKISLHSKNLNIANVVVPTLIVQIDGIILDFLKTNKLNTGKYTDRKNDFKNNKPPALPQNYESLVNDVLLEILFQEAKTGLPLKNPYQFNRHKIIHGENKTYGRRDYLVRLILILDYLAHIRSPKSKK